MSYSLLDSARAGLLVSFPEGMVSCRPGQVLVLELRVFCWVMWLLQCESGCMGRRIPPWRRTASADLLVSFPVGMVSCNPGHALVLVPLVFCWVKCLFQCWCGYMRRRVPPWRRAGPAVDHKLMCDMSMFPALRPAAVVPPGRLFMRWRVGTLEFSRPCTRGGFCDASGAEAGFLPGRCCAASLCSISYWY